MRFLARILIAIAINAIALYLAAHFVTGFVLTGTLQEIFILALILTVLNFTVKPLLTLILGPVIILTFGIGIIAVNALILYILDIFSQNLTIQTIPALVFGTLIFGAVNFVFHMGRSK